MDNRLWSVNRCIEGFVPRVPFFCRVGHSGVVLDRLRAAMGENPSYTQRVKAHQRHLSVQTRGRGLYDVTGEVARVVSESGVTTGLCSLFLRHTSASLVIQENADVGVLRDLSRWMDRIAPEGSDYEHDAEGPDDMPSHIRTSITRTSESIPVTDGALSLGTWQALYVWEHRRTGHPRELVVHVAGE